MSVPKFKDKHLHDSLVNPYELMSKVRDRLPDLPKKYVFVYEKFVLNHLLRKYHPKKIYISSRMTIYKYKSVGIVRFEGIGSPYVAGYFENLVALGGEVFLNIGFAGGLHREGVIICEKALRDDGTSHHYVPTGDFAHPDKELTTDFKAFLYNKKVIYHSGDCWTTDSYFRETKAEVDKYYKEGICAVEMESSALFTIAKFRGVKVASAFVVSDILKDKWEPK